MIFSFFQCSYHSCIFRKVTFLGKMNPGTTDKIYHHNILMTWHITHAWENGIASLQEPRGWCCKSHRTQMAVHSCRIRKLWICILNSNKTQEILLILWCPISHHSLELQCTVCNMYECTFISTVYTQCTTVMSHLCS